MALIQDSLEHSHTKKFVLDHLDQYVLTSDQLLTQFVKVIAIIFAVQLSVVYMFSIKKTV